MKDQPIRIRNAERVISIQAIKKSEPGELGSIYPPAKARVVTLRCQKSGLPQSSTLILANSGGSAPSAYLGQLRAYRLALLTHRIQLNRQEIGLQVLQQRLGILAEGAARPAEHHNLRQNAIRCIRVKFSGHADSSSASGRLRGTGHLR